MKLDALIINYEDVLAGNSICTQRLHSSLSCRIAICDGDDTNIVRFSSQPAYCTLEMYVHNYIMLLSKPVYIFTA